MIGHSRHWAVMAQICASTNKEEIAVRQTCERTTGVCVSIRSFVVDWHIHTKWDSSLTSKRYTCRLLICLAFVIEHSLKLRVHLLTYTNHYNTVTLHMSRRLN